MTDLHQPIDLEIYNGQPFYMKIFVSVANLAKETLLFFILKTSQFLTK